MTPNHPPVSEPVSLKPRFHVEGQTSTVGPRWQIWDGEQHYARFQNVATEADANKLCEALNALSPSTQTDGLAERLSRIRSEVFAILRKHEVDEQCFAEVAMVTFDPALRGSGALLDEGDGPQSLTTTDNPSASPTPRGAGD